ncbi:Universal stress protein family [Bordetella ansorpii]|uniref:Universal stress protein family n=1 Tax=Bordetella ansorpii TaxID=288768 RepID=A0A157SCT5_9BORD|nr:universal stress protein [Bordetella ansorpii]SAI68252.1 Universal stress protein family [Bordetella ansorpii]
MKQVIACLDGIARAQGICDYAIWATRRMDTDLEFLHVQEPHCEQAGLSDLSGSLWLGAQEALLRELSELDEKRAAVEQEHGKQLLELALERARAAGLSRLDARQYRGDLIDTLIEAEPDARLFVLGHHTALIKPSRLLPDHRLEAAVRALHRPILVADAAFREPASFMVAYDGSATARKTVEMVSRSPLLAGLRAHVVMAGGDAAQAQGALNEARAELANTGFDARTAHVPGDPVQALTAYAGDHAVDLIAMGAYGHSRIRHLMLGSTTTAILGQVRLPLLILR